ncbi:MAG: hypothetical protein WA021_02670 [Minisyncoccia bacterium]
MKLFPVLAGALCILAIPVVGRSVHAQQPTPTPSCRQVQNCDVVKNLQGTVARQDRELTAMKERIRLLEARPVPSDPSADILTLKNQVATLIGPQKFCLFGVGDQNDRSWLRFVPVPHAWDVGECSALVREAGNSGAGALFSGITIVAAACIFPAPIVDQKGWRMSVGTEFAVGQHKGGIPKENCGWKNAN